MIKERNKVETSQDEAAGGVTTLENAAPSYLPTYDLSNENPGEKMFNFHEQEASFKVPIIEYKDKILDIVGGENIGPL